MDRARKSRVVDGKKADLVEQQQTRVQRVAIHRAHETAEASVPAAVAHHFVNAGRLGPPVGGTVRQGEAGGNAGQPVASGPADHTRKRVDPAGTAQFPDAGVRLVEEPRRALAQRLEAMKQDLVFVTDQPPIEEHVRRSQDRGAVHVMLNLTIRLVADPHRTHATIAGKRIEELLLDDGASTDAVHRLEASVIRARHDIEDVGEIALHRPGDPQPVERVHHEIRVPQPAIAIVPVAAAVGCLGNGRRHRRDDRAGILECVEFQGDRRPDHRVLPFEGNGQMAHPPPPVGDRFVAEMSRDLFHRALEGFIGPEDQADVVLQEEGSLFHDRRHRHISGQPDHDRPAKVSDVIAAAGLLRGVPTVMAGRPQADPHPRIAGDPADPPDQRHGTEHPAVLAESRGEVGDFDAGAARVEQAGDQDRRVDEVFLLLRDAVEQIHREEAGIVLTGPFAQQRAERRIAVEARKACPYNLAKRIHQAADRPVADQPQIEGGHRVAFGVGRPCCSQSRTAATSRRRQQAAVGPGPTLIESPPR